jgi:ribonuclease-3
VYELRDEGPDHDKVFFADVLVGGRRRGSGSGRTKKAAEQQAAAEAIDSLRANHA